MGPGALELERGKNKGLAKTRSERVLVSPRVRAGADELEREKGRAAQREWQKQRKACAHVVSSVDGTPCE